MSVLSPQDFAESYNPPEVYENSWAAVEQYQMFLEVREETPEAGRVALARAMSERLNEEIPPSRVRTWLKGGMPDTVRGI